MQFNLWHCLNMDKDLQIQKRNIDTQLNISVNQRYTSNIDDEGVYRVYIDVKGLDELVELPYILGDDIVIHGSDSNIIMTVKTMRELGLG